MRSTAPQARPASSACSTGDEHDGRSRWTPLRLRRVGPGKRCVLARVVSCCHLTLSSPPRCAPHRRRRAPCPHAKSAESAALHRRFDSPNIRRAKIAASRRQFTRHASDDPPPVALSLVAHVGPVATVHRSTMWERIRPSLGVERLADVLPPRAGRAIHSAPVAASTIGLLGMDVALMGHLGITQRKPRAES